jgi:hypothetical protein
VDIIITYAGGRQVLAHIQLAAPRDLELVEVCPSMRKRGVGDMMCRHIHLAVCITADGSNNMATETAALINFSFAYTATVISCLPLQAIVSPRILPFHPAACGLCPVMIFYLSFRVSGAMLRSGIFKLHPQW